MGQLSCNSSTSINNKCQILSRGDVESWMWPCVVDHSENITRGTLLPFVQGGARFCQASEEVGILPIFGEGCPDVISENQKASTPQ